MDARRTIDEIARLDLARRHRAGIPEVVLAQGKSDAQLTRICEELLERAGRALVTRLEPGRAERLAERFAERAAIELAADGWVARLVAPDAPAPQGGGAIGLLSAGTSDIPVAEEARLVAEEMGCRVVACYDVGIAGLHRLVDPLRRLDEAGVACVVVAAGMDGALPAVVKGLVAVPVIGLPTSVGYGLGGRGEAALMTMLQSCSPGLTVVNIDNGLGAGAAAALIANREAAARQAARAEEATDDG